VGGAGRLLPPDALPGEAVPARGSADGGELTLPACMGHAVTSATVLSKPQELCLGQAGSPAPLPGPAAMGLTRCVASLGGVRGGRLSLKRFGVLCCVAARRCPGFAARFCSAGCWVGLLRLAWCGAARKPP